MNDRFDSNLLASTSTPSPCYSLDPFMQVPERSFGRSRTLSPNSDGSSTPSSIRHTSHESEGEKPVSPSKKRKRGNKKAPVSYPPEMQELIDDGSVIWGQHIDGIGPFEPSSIQDHHSYSVFTLGSLESRVVTQAQAFSGRDEEVEDWAARSAAVPRVMRPLPRSRFSPRGVRSPLVAYSGDGIPLGWALTPPPLDRVERNMTQYYPTPPQAARYSPFSTESVVTSVSAEDHYQISPPSTSSSYGGTMFAGSSTHVPAIVQSNFQGAVNYPPAPSFAYPSALPHHIATANQQAPAVNVGMDYANSFPFDGAMVQPTYQLEAQAPYPEANTFGSPAASFVLDFDGIWEFS